MAEIIVKINLNEIQNKLNIEDIEGYSLIQKKFIKTESDNPQLILFYTDNILPQNASLNFTEKLVNNKKINNERFIDIFKDNKSKLMLYYYLRSKRVVLAYKYNVELFEILTNEGLYTLIDKQIRTSNEFNSNSVLKKFKLYKDDLLNYCNDFYMYQLPTNEELYNKLSNFYITEWTYNLDIQKIQSKKRKGNEDLDTIMNDSTKQIQDIRISLINLNLL